MFNIGTEKDDIDASVGYHLLHIFNAWCLNTAASCLIFMGRVNAALTSANTKDPEDSVFFWVLVLVSSTRISDGVKTYKLSVSGKGRSKVRVSAMRRILKLFIKPAST